MTNKRKRSNSQMVISLSYLQNEQHLAIFPSPPLVQFIFPLLQKVSAVFPFLRFVAMQEATPFSKRDNHVQDRGTDDYENLASHFHTIIVTDVGREWTKKRDYLSLPFEQVLFLDPSIGRWSAQYCQSFCEDGRPILRPSCSPYHDSGNWCNTPF